ncbi:MAPEG family protein [Candidatus Albibeggiatoa sp. nov. BB20]|uniref:MAPEG family protein n=1 Tax=Candidatus Albibeggiatoa sp. nov. BB20 TaxID=3162723 RepID=UPI003365478E
MEQNLILLPIFALVALTFGIGIWLGKLRFAAVKQGDLNPKYYELNQGDKAPDYLTKVSHNYDNLLALPILFYVIAILLFVTEQVEIVQIILAWVFVASRYIHSYIHTTHNNVRSRMKAFLFGVVILISMWCLYFVQMMPSYI